MHVHFEYGYGDDIVKITDEARHLDLLYELSLFNWDDDRFFAVQIDKGYPLLVYQESKIGRRFYDFFHLQNSLLYVP